jgi:hypothetical protein
MKIKQLLLAIVVGLSLSQSRAAVLTITEVSGTGFNAISADYDGTPLAIDLTGAEEGWTIELPGTFLLSSLGEVIVGEAGDPSLVNSVLVGTAPTFIVWTGDLPAPVGGPFPSSVLLAGAGIFGGNETFDLVLREILPTATPDAGSTAILLAGALAAGGLSRRFLAAAR